MLEVTPTPCIMPCLPPAIHALNAIRFMPSPSSRVLRARTERYLFVYATSKRRLFYQEPELLFERSLAPMRVILPNEEKRNAETIMLHILLLSAVQVRCWRVRRYMRRFAYYALQHESATPSSCHARRLQVICRLC